MSNTITSTADSPLEVRLATFQTAALAIVSGVVGGTAIGLALNFTTLYLCMRKYAGRLQTVALTEALARIGIKNDLYFQWLGLGKPPLPGESNPGES